MIYYPELESHIGDKVKVVLDLSNYVTKKGLNDTTDTDTSNLAAKSDFSALKSEVDKLDVNILVNVLTTLNVLKIKVDDLDADKLKTVTIDLKKLSDVVDKRVSKT